MINELFITLPVATIVICFIFSRAIVKLNNPFVPIWINHTLLLCIKHSCNLIVANNISPEIAKQYATWKAQGVEVVFVSLDEDKTQFNRYATDFPFISICDYKKWESPIAKDYYVFGTPTMFLLNDKREILLRPNSVKQMDAWVDWVLTKGNK